LGATLARFWPMAEAMYREVRQVCKYITTALSSQTNYDTSSSSSYMPYKAFSLNFKAIAINTI